MSKGPIPIAAIIASCLGTCWVVGAAVAAGGAGGAAAPEPMIQACGLAEKGVIVVDGLLDDWKGVPGSTSRGSESSDAIATVRCNHDLEQLYLSIEIADESLLRTKQGKKEEDHVALLLAGVRVEVFPADPDQAVPRRLSVTGASKGAGLAIAESLQTNGWAVEVGARLRDLPEWSETSAGIPFSIEVRDSDRSSGAPKTGNGAARTGGTVKVGPGFLVTDEGAEMAEWFLSEVKLRTSDLYLNTFVDLDGSPGPERVLAGGRFIGMLAAGYSYVELPVTSAADVLEARLVDLAADGRSRVFVRYVERGRHGSREVVAVFVLSASGSIARIFAHEIAKVIDDRSIRNRWALQPLAAGKKGTRGLALVISSGEAVGFDAENFVETPAEDMQPILLPWGKCKEETWTFRGNEAFGGASNTPASR
ncbi:MAG: hypothetical protein V2A73_03665 [Pseudomonadota bacterium]